MMFLHRVLEDENFKPSKDLIKIATTVKPLIMKKKHIPDNLKSKLNYGTRKAYENMTYDEYCAYVRDFMDTNEVGLTNLKRGEAFYLPMVEIISYLTNNGFKVYMNSAAEREIVRCLIENAINIPSDRLLGSHIEYISTKQEKNSGENYNFDRYKEKIVRSNGYYSAKIRFISKIQIKQTEKSIRCTWLRLSMRIHQSSEKQKGAILLLLFLFCFM